MDAQDACNASKVEAIHVQLERVRVQFWGVPMWLGRRGIAVATGATAHPLAADTGQAILDLRVGLLTFGAGKHINKSTPSPSISPLPAESLSL